MAEPVPAKLEEVLVTAQKRVERLIDVPQAVSVLSADALGRMAAVKLTDLSSSVPGLGFVTVGVGDTQVSLRGVTVGFDLSPTVAMYVDEVPYGSSTNFGQGGQVALDAGLFDMERIEVLRGPQGTLYGASSIGGLVKYVTPMPSTEKLAGRMQVGIAAIEQGGLSYNGAASFNAPFKEGVLALRMSGFYSHDGGYIDDVARGADDVNRSNVYGGRADVLLTPTEELSIRLTGFLQDVDRDGTGSVDYTFSGTTPYGALAQYRPLAEPFDQRFSLVSGTVTYDFDWAALTSISSYQTVRSSVIADASGIYVPLFQAFLDRSYGAVGTSNNPRTNKFVQEVRLASDDDSVLEWVLGGFYNREASDKPQKFLLFDESGQPATNDVYVYSAPSRYEEYAAFGDLTLHLTEQLDMTGGLRYAHNSQVYTQYGSGFFVSSRPTARSSEDVFTYLANVRYRFTEHAIAYVRFATGYRPGGPNSSAIDPVTGLPLGSPTFEADKLKSYEIGFKGETDDRRFSAEASLYEVDWSNIQLVASQAGFGFIANAPGGAKVRGAELSVIARPTGAFSITGSFAYVDAHMSAANADLGAIDGERLPNVPRWSAVLGADYSFAQRWQPTAGCSVRYVSDRYAAFDASPSGQYRLPDYTTIDMYAGIALGKVEARLYVHNLLDERGQISASIADFARATVIGPRTIGMSFTTGF